MGNVRTSDETCDTLPRHSRPPNVQLPDHRQNESQHNPARARVAEPQQQSHNLPVPHNPHNPPMKTPRHVGGRSKQRMHGRPAEAAPIPTAQASSSPRGVGRARPSPPLTRVGPARTSARASPGSEATPRSTPTFNRRVALTRLLYPLDGPSRSKLSSFVKHAGYTPVGPDSPHSQRLRRFIARQSSVPWPRCAKDPSV